MEQCAESYATFVMEEVAKAKQTTVDPIVIVEQRLDFSRYVPDGFGTGDCLVIADGTLSVIDMKYGLGILVDAYQNPQMMCYALGALELFDGIYDIQEVKMTTFQPRRENVSTYTLPKEELLQWANAVLSPAADLAFKGEGEYHCGKWCQWYPAKNSCRTRAEHNLKLAEYEFKPPDLLIKPCKTLRVLIIVLVAYSNSMEPTVPDALQDVASSFKTCLRTICQIYLKRVPW